MVNTTIKITKETKELLNEFKIHPRQSYEEIIRSLVDCAVELEEKKK
jgi:hypothetical protein